MSNLIVKWNHEALRTVCDPVAADSDLRFVEVMKRALRDSRNGVGLAAPQVGVTKRVILLRPNGGIIETCINPEIIWRDDRKATAPEGCLSYPGTQAEIERSVSVRVRYFDARWKPIERLVTGFEAIIFQHEMDHLDGICQVGDAWRATKARAA